jgi:hypothetical protein
LVKRSDLHLIKKKPKRGRKLKPPARFTDKLTKSPYSGRLKFERTFTKGYENGIR